MIILHLPWPPSVNSANNYGSKGYYPSKEKQAFVRDAGVLFLTQKRALSGQKIEGPFTYHLTLNRALRHPLADGDNRGKYPLDCAQKFGLIAERQACRRRLLVMGRMRARGDVEYPSSNCCVCVITISRGRK
jgi:hypothetical protein